MNTQIDTVLSGEPTLGPSELMARMKGREWQNSGYAIAFIINILVVLALWIYFAVAKNDTGFDMPSGAEIVSNYLIPLGISILIITAFLLLVIFAPKFFISGIFIFSFCFLAAAIIMYSFSASLYFLIFGVLIVAILVYMCVKSKSLTPSSNLFVHVGKLLTTFPLSILFLVVWILITCINTIIYSTIAAIMTDNKYIQLIHMYCALIYLWFSFVESSIMHYVFSGLSIYHTLLESSPEMPKSPIAFLVKYALTTSFGSICEAALLWPLYVFASIVTCIHLKTDDNGLAFCAILGCNLEEGTKRYRLTEIEHNRGKCLVYPACTIITIIVFILGTSAGYTIAKSVFSVVGVVAVATVFSGLMTGLSLSQTATAVSTSLTGLFIACASNFQIVSQYHPDLIRDMDEFNRFADNK